jgi:hypothetical protein
MMQRRPQDTGRREHSLLDALFSAHYLWIRLLATPITTLQVIDLNHEYFHAQKLIRRCRRAGHAAGKIAPAAAKATFAHLLWIRLLARLLRLINPIDFKELFFRAQKCGNRSGYGKRWQESAIRFEKKHKK